jgi:predicted ATPase
MLKEIKIKGYKSLKEVTLDLRPINILIGANGVGKSNFITFFGLVNNIYEQNLQGYSMACGADSLLYYGLKHTTQIEGNLDFGNNAYAFKLSPAKDGSLYIAEEKNVYQNSNWIYPSQNIRESKIKDSSRTRDRYLRDCLASYRIYHFHDTEMNSKLRSKYCNIDDNERFATDGSNLPAFLYLLQEKFPTSLKRIEMVVRSVMPYFHRFVLRPNRLDESKIGLVWQDKNDLEKYFDASDLSDGSLRFIALTTLFMQPELPKTIIVDEPELGLHPVAISKLAGMIKSASRRDCQVIISTQSAELIDNFEPDDILTVDRGAEGTVISRLDSKSLQSWLESYTLGELWTKSVIKGQPL